MEKVSDFSPEIYNHLPYANSSLLWCLLTMQFSSKLCFLSRPNICLEWTSTQRCFEPTSSFMCGQASAFRASTCSVKNRTRPKALVGLQSVSDLNIFTSKRVLLHCMSNFVSEVSRPTAAWFLPFQLVWLGVNFWKKINKIK